MRTSVSAVGAAECGAEALSETLYDSHSEPVSFPAARSSSSTRLCRGLSDAVKTMKYYYDLKQLFYM